MYIPSISGICPAKILSSLLLMKRDDLDDAEQGAEDTWNRVDQGAQEVTQDIKTTAQLFRSWDTCMDNRVCRPIAIVGILLAGLVGLWIAWCLWNCICNGASCKRSMLCCCHDCCQGKKKQRKYNGMTTKEYKKKLMKERKERRMGINTYLDRDINSRQARSQRRGRKNDFRQKFDVFGSSKKNTYKSPPMQQSYQYQYQPPSSMPPSYSGYKNDYKIGSNSLYEFDNESLASTRVDTNSVRDFISSHTPSFQSPLTYSNSKASKSSKALNHASTYSSSSRNLTPRTNGSRGQNTYF